MSRRHRIAERPRVISGVMAGLGYAVLVSFSHPFTWAADVAIAVPLIVVAAAATRSDLRAQRSGAGGSAGIEIHGGWRSSRGALLWLAPVLAVTGWELYCFVNVPRVEHPTLSSLIDLLDATRPGKTVAVVSWLALGWFLVSR